MKTFRDLQGHYTKGHSLAECQGWKVLYNNLAPLKKNFKMSL